MYTVLLEYESVGPDIWPKHKCRSLWPIFHGPMIVPYTMKTISYMNIIIGIMNRYDLKINVDHRDLYFMVQWFNVISWRLSDVWTSSLGIMCQDDRTFWPLNKCKSLWPIFHGPLIFPYISKTIWWISVIFLDNETVWHKLWPLFHGLVILFNIFKIIWWMNIIVSIMDQCDI